MTNKSVITIVGLMIIFATPAASAQSIPEWVKNNPGWWAEGIITDEDFISGIQFLIQIGLIAIEEQVESQTLVGEFTDGDFFTEQVEPLR